MEYFNLLCYLHNKNMMKRNLPKYTANPFHMPVGVDRWSDFCGRLRSRCVNNNNKNDPSDMSCEAGVLVNDIETGPGNLMYLVFSY